MAEQGRLSGVLSFRRMEEGPLQTTRPVKPVCRLWRVGEGRGSHECGSDQAAAQILGFALEPEESANALCVVQLGKGAHEKGLAGQAEKAPVKNLPP